jgi:ribosomal protein S18 acetylase RimI-like enzyme
MVIREFDRAADIDGLRACLIELQNFEREIDSRIPTGEDIADAYIRDAMSQCEECAGTILVVEVNATIAGYVTILSRVRSGEIDDGDLEYAYLADLIVRAEYRNAGLGKKLMSRAETYARDHGAKSLRVCVRAANENAKRLYLSSGYSELYVEFEKEFNSGVGDA